MGKKMRGGPEGGRAPRSAGWTPSRIVVWSVWAAAACGGERVDPSRLERVAIPVELQAGEAAFTAHCQACHGVRATGTPQGPPLVDRVYEPGHHGDAAFVLAAQRGVRAHHWRFGDMPPVPDATESEIRGIIGYVRWLQRQAGIE